MTRTSIARLADCAPVPQTDVKWGTDCAPVPHEDSWPARRPPRIAYIDDTPVMNAVHAALKAEARSTAAAVIKMAARAYALQPRHLDAIMGNISKLSPKHLVLCLGSMHGKAPSINVRGAMLYARYTRAKARQIARRAA